MHPHKIRPVGIPKALSDQMWSVLVVTPEAARQLRAPRWDALEPVFPPDAMLFWIPHLI